MMDIHAIVKPADMHIPEMDRVVFLKALQELTLDGCANI